MISLDLDGVSAETDSLHVWFSDAVARALNEAARRGVVWCSNSGRRAENQFGMIQACRILDALPTAILSGERYIHDIHPSRSTVLPRQPQHEQAKSLALALAPRVKTALDAHLAAIDARFPGADYYPADEFVGWLLPPAAESAAFVAEIRERLQSVPEAQVLRNGMWIIVTHVSFGKGKVLAAAAGELRVPRERILAVGDQPNDLDMLDGRVAAHVGCPADADDEVKATVARAGGLIAESAGCAGTVQLIHRFLEIL